MIFRAMVIVLAAMLSTPAVAAEEVQCPPSAGEVDVRVVPRVDYDPGRQIYTYRYTLESLRSSRLPVDNLDIPVPKDKVGGVASPEGWIGGAQEVGAIGNERYVVHWLAHKVKKPHKMGDASIPRSISALEPGKTVGPFVMESPLPPGARTAFVSGEIRPGPVSSEAEMERLYAQCETMREAYLEAARKVRTVGPVEGDFLPVRIDIMPDSADNPVNPSQQGVVPVAVLGSKDLAVSQIDPDTLAFGPDRADPAHSRLHRARDINDDGHLDQLVHFPVPDTGLACFDAAAFLRAQTVDGQKLLGFDMLSTPGCRGNQKATKHHGD